MRFTFKNATALQPFPSVLEGWKEIPLLGEKKIQSYGFVVSCIGMLIVSMILDGTFVPHGFWSTLLPLVGTIPIHELIHAVSTPGWGLSSKTIVGIQKSKALFMPYVYYDGEQSLWQFLLTGLAPTIFLTVLPISAIKFMSLDAPYQDVLGFLSFFNMGISGGDLVIVMWLATQLDRRSSVRQHGWKLHWKVTT
jgi:hypothetical protein